MRFISFSLVSLVVVASFVACGGTTPGEGGSGPTSGTSSAGGSGGAGGAGSTGTGTTSTESTSSSSSTGSSSSGSGGESGGGDVLRVDIDGTTTDLSTGASGAYAANKLAMNITGGSAPGSGDALGLTITLYTFSPFAAGTFPCKPAGALDQRASLIFTNSTKFKTLSANATSGDCTVTVTTVEPAGGRVKGTFTATMVGQGPTTSQFTNGSFDLPTK